MSGKAPPPPVSGVWLLTESFNDYDQHGPVPRCVWATKPTLNELVVYFKYDHGTHTNVMAALDFIMHIQNGGGRRDNESSWYELYFVPFGKRIGDDA